MTSISSASGGSPSTPDITSIETQIADGTGSPLLGLQDWSAEGILARLTGQDSVLPAAKQIQQGVDPSTLAQDTSSATSGSADAGTSSSTTPSSAPSSSASSTMSAMNDSML